jgi:hypothetical protein
MQTDAQDISKYSRCSQLRHLGLEAFDLGVLDVEVVVDDGRGLGMGALANKLARVAWAIMVRGER